MASDYDGRKDEISYHPIRFTKSGGKLRTEFFANLRFFSAYETMTLKDESTTIVTEMCNSEFRRVDRLFEIAYDDLHDVARHYTGCSSSERLAQPTEILHEAYLRLVDQSQVDWRGKSHFMAVGSAVMRNLLVDMARQKRSQKRGGRHRRIALEEAVTVSVTNMEDILAVDEALTRLATVNEMQSKLVQFRYFGGMTVSEAAKVLGISKRSAEKLWTFARAWLRRELSRGTDDDC